MRLLVLVSSIVLLFSACKGYQELLNKASQPFVEEGIPACFELRVDEVYLIGDTSILLLESLPVELKSYEVKSSFLYPRDPWREGTSKPKKYRNIKDTVYITSNLSVEEYDFLLKHVIDETRRFAKFDTAADYIILPGREGLMFLDDEVVITVFQEHFTLQIYKQNMIYIKALEETRERRREGQNCLRSDMLVLQGKNSKIEYSIHYNSDLRITPNQAIEWYENKLKVKQRN